jgi:membrane associated rhomboid family serine protease
LTAALGLLAFLGTGGGGASGDVDIIAHLTGFIAGLAIGALLAAGEPSRLTRLGRAAAGAAAAVVVAAWLWGFAAG